MGRIKLHIQPAIGINKFINLDAIKLHVSPSELPNQLHNDQIHNIIACSAAMQLTLYVYV